MNVNFTSKTCPVKVLLRFKPLLVLFDFQVRKKRKYELDLFCCSLKTFEDIISRMITFSAHFLAHNFFEKHSYILEIFNSFEISANFGVIPFYNLGIYKMLYRHISVFCKHRQKCRKYLKNEKTYLMDKSMN